MKECPKGALALRGSKVVVTDPVKCDLCRACADASEGGLEIVGDPTKFVFRVESISGLDPGYIAQKAAEILALKTEDFRKQLAKV